MEKLWGTVQECWGGGFSSLWPRRHCPARLSCGSRQVRSLLLELGVAQRQYGMCTAAPACSPSRWLSSYGEEQGLLGLTAQLAYPARRLSSYGQEQLRWLDRELSEGRHTLIVVSWLPSDACVVSRVGAVQPRWLDRELSRGRHTLGMVSPDGCVSGEKNEMYT